ncbi:hypothetical protein [Mucilaginibacter antarcticus]|uniref:PliI/PliC-like inhibitor of I-type lysozyme n=1 Tax=Mucilaginibacter antarcticus TaxID=1855725 RepID=A0ABW5XR94_9SPHI
MCVRSVFYILFSCAIFSGCSQEPKKVAANNAPKADAVKAPFKYQKMIEVAPGQYYDVMSWGRGAGKESVYMILHSDSSNQKFTTTTGDLDGAITDVYNSDMDMDGNPEILIQAKGTDSINFTHIYAYEFKGSNAQKLDFPKLQSSKKNYRGDDKFYISEGKLIREFPSYTSSGSDGKLTGGKYKFEYSLQGNELAINTLVKDSTQMEKPEPAKTVKKTEEKPKVTKSTKKKKVVAKKRRRRRR